MKERIENLQHLLSKNFFPISEWKDRGLMPSDNDVIEQMNNEIYKFINYINSVKESKNIEQDLEAYFSKWERGGFDTEEMEYIFDTFFELIRECQIDVDKIRI